MRSLLTISAILELITGLALVIMPTAVVSLLLNGSLTEATGMILGRIAGVALLSLALACWQARNDSTFSIVMIRAMLLYDIGATTLLVYAALIEKIFSYWFVACSFAACGITDLVFTVIAEKGCRKKQGQS